VAKEAIVLYEKTANFAGSYSFLAPTDIPEFKTIEAYCNSGLR